MQYFGCCPNPEGNDTIETTLTTQQFSARSTLNATQSTSLHNRRHSIVSPSATSLNGTDCNAPVNPYRVLELRRDATPSEIIGSYRKLALMYHPGRKISCPLERKKRVQFFEVLAACYETLMHSEFRRKCDILLKDMDKKHSSQMTKRKAKQLQNNPLPLSFGSNNLAIKGADSIPGLIPSTSQSSSASGGARNNQSVGGSEESNDTLLRNNCTSLGGILVCAGGTRALTASSTINKTFTLSRDGTKGFKSLADSSSLSASQSQGSTEEGEIHFSEATVNRLFGGPMASLHRARNFQAFSDPYLVFDKVFGNKKPIFPRVTMADVLTTADKSTEGAQVENRHLTGIGNNALRSSASQFSHPGLEPYSLLGKNQNDDLSANTRVFVSSRIVNGRKITKTETVHVNPATGVASVNVTVDGEYLQPVISKKISSKLYGTSVADWLLCFGTAKVTPATRSAATEKNNKSSQMMESSICCRKGQSESASEEKEIASSCHSFKSLYVEALEEFYLCNDNFHEECNKYMRCGRP